jgi:hypothetical protein
VDTDEYNQRLAELERAEAANRERLERQVQDLAQRVASLESFLTERYG